MSEEHNNKPVYSFWAEQVALQSPPAPDDTAGDCTGSEYIQSHNSTPLEPVKKNGFFGKTIPVIFTALLFGLIASLSFLGFNELYYHYNPDAKAVNISAVTKGSQTSLNLDPPEGKVKLSTTKVQSDYIFNLNTDISHIVEQTMPATVSITSIVPVTSYIFGQAYTEESICEGSGIILSDNETEYLIVTNSHVVSDATALKVLLIDDTTVNAHLKGKETESDLAVIAINKSDLSPETINAISIAKIGNSDNVKVGQMVIAIGNAMGYGQSVTVGYVSAKDRIITNSATNATLTVLQVDAAINPGNSGGALLNVNGEVIGINSAKLTGLNVEGMGYAIPITKAFPIVSDLMNRETLADEDKGYLGILMSGMSDITESISMSYNWPMGVYIREITPDSAAERAGLRSGDIITAVNGTAINTKQELREKVTSYRYDTVVTISIMRYKGNEFEEMNIDVKLGKASN